MKKAIFTTLLMACMTIHAQIHSYVDSNGNTIYTDNPPEGLQTRTLDIKPTVTNKVESAEPTAEEANLKTVRLSPQGNAVPASGPAINQQMQRTINYRLLEITSPENKATIANSGGQMMVSVKSEPTLAVGHKYRILVDGKVIQESTSAAFSINNLERGEHKLLAEIINANNQVIIKSPEKVIYIRQTTLADKRRVNPCKFDDYGVRPECPIEDRPKPIPHSWLRAITDKTGLTKPCLFADYGARADCPIEKKPQN